MRVSRRNLLLFTLIPFLLAATFFAGAFANKKCVYPFCRGYTDQITGLFAGQSSNNSKPVEASDEQGINTNRYRLAVQKISLPLDKEHGNGMLADIGFYGGIDVLGDGLIVASGTGILFYIDKDSTLHRLPVSIPFPQEAFLEAMSETEGEESVRASVKDILAVEESSEAFRLFASYNHWNREEECFTLRVAQTVLPRPVTELSEDEVSWETLYDTQPCLELEHRAGHQAGGRIVRFSESEILVSVGDEFFDGVTKERSLPQDPDNSHGKVVLVDFTSKEARIFSLGHRNPQGLHIDPEGRIWSTEHGPEGGDELNLIEEGRNYGWPLVTYGTDYGEHAWPSAEQNDSHEGFAQPVYTWVPSIGISQLISVQKDLFERWKGDLLVSSLVGNKLFRIRQREGQVVFSEPIHIGERIRDLVEASDGSIVIKTDRDDLLVLRPADESEAADEPEDRVASNDEARPAG